MDFSWLRRRRPAQIFEIKLKYARAEKVGRNRWKIKVFYGAIPFVFDFVGSDAAAARRVQEEDRDARDARETRAREAERARKLEKIHLEGNHNLSVPADECPRCIGLALTTQGTAKRRVLCWSCSIGHHDNPKDNRCNCCRSGHTDVR